MAEEAPVLDHKHLIKAVKDGLEARGTILSREETAALISRHGESDVEKLVELILADIAKGGDPVRHEDGGATSHRHGAKTR
mmetsp:Transcript_8514/g.30277  ORF Transcript_8514/g.30277 Transcript_8514/m.30277 type:complete len:81 (+) Transcript_8514:120-362(+)